MPIQPSQAHVALARGAREQRRSALGFQRQLPAPGDYSIPVFFTTSVDLPPNSQGDGENEALRNTFNVPMEVTGFSFQVLYSPTTTTATGTPGTAGGAVGCQMKVGSFALTNGFVPVWNFGRAIALSQELLFDPTNIPDYMASQYDARLDTPFMLPPGQGIHASFQNFGLTMNSEVTARISVYGRLMTKAPADDAPVRLPWFAPWRAGTFYLGAANSAASTQTDLITPPGRGMRLNAFIGRCARWDTSVSGTQQFILDDSFSSGAGTIFEAITLRILDSRGYSIVRTPTIWGQVFNSLSRTMDCGPRGVPIPASTYWKVYLEQAAIVNVHDGSLCAPQISAIGSYAVKYAEVKP